MKSGYENSETLNISKSSDQHEQPKHLVNSESVLGDEESTNQSDSESETSASSTIDSNDRINSNVFDQAKEHESNNTENKERKPKSPYIALGASAVLLAAAIIITSTANHGGNKNNNAAATPVPSSTTGETMSSSVPSESALSSMVSSVSGETQSKSTSEQSSNASETEASVETPKAITLKQDKTVAEMDAMTEDDFFRLPYADRAAYAYAKVKNGITDLKEAFDPTTTPGFYWKSWAGNSYDCDTATEGRKILSSLYYSVIDLSNNTIDSSFENDISQVGTHGGVDNFTYKAHGSVQHNYVLDENISNADFMDITYQMSDPNTGDPVKEEQTVQVFNILVKMDNGQTIRMYPMGYGTSGEKSPVSGYSY